MPRTRLSVPAARVDDRTKDEGTSALHSLPGEAAALGLGAADELGVGGIDGDAASEGDADAGADPVAEGATLGAGGFAEPLGDAVGD